MDPRARFRFGVDLRGATEMDGASVEVLQAHPGPATMVGDRLGIEPRAVVFDEKIEVTAPGQLHADLRRRSMTAGIGERFF